MHRIPLSKDLEQVLADESSLDRLTINELIRQTEGRGIYLVMILLSLPFITPLPLPGLSNILGVVMMILGARLALGREARLPRLLGDRPLQARRFQRIVRGSVRVVRFVEQCVRPRRSQWLRWGPVRLGNALLLAFMGFVLALPIPPIVLFSNALPSYAIILTAASMMEEDGIMIWFGYAVAASTVVYLLSMAGLIAGFIARYYDEITRWLTAWP
jgi:hypothetical protein